MSQKGNNKPRRDETHDTSLEALAQSASIPDLLALVRSRGIEDSSDLIRFLPPEKLRILMDLDVWRNRSSRAQGRAEHFDAPRFLIWLEALLDSGMDEAVEALQGLGLEFCAGALAHFLEATPMEIYAMNRAESGLGIEDKQVEHGRAREVGVFGGCYVLTKSATQSPALKSISNDDLIEIMSDLLAGFETHAPEFLRGVFYEISRHVDDDVAIEDFQADRNLRLEQQGYVPATKAAELLLRFRNDRGLLQASGFARRGAPLWSPEVWARFAEGRALSTNHDDPSKNPSSASGSLALLLGNGGPSPAQNVAALAAWASELGPAEQQHFQNQWYFLANLIATGWEFRGERIPPALAMTVVEVSVELGTSITLGGLRSEGAPASLCCLFERGWSYLYQQMGRRAALSLDVRLRSRLPENRELRESFFAFCSGLRLTDVSVAGWLAQGRYHRVSQALDAMEFAFHSRTTHLLRTLLDPVPSVPALWQSPSLREAQSQFQGRGSAVPPQGPSAPVTWFWTPGSEEPWLEQLKFDLADFSDPYG